MLTNIQIDENELNKKLEKKLFWALVITGCIANLAGFLSNMMLFGHSLPTMVCGVCVAIMVIVSALGIHFKKRKTAGAVIVLLLALIEFPFLFYVYGATMGVYLVLGIMALAVYFPRPYHIPAIVVAMGVDVAAILLFYFYPSTIERVSWENQAQTMICSYLIVAVACAVVLCNLINQYDLQHKHLVEVSRELEYAANRDALTGVYNRRYLIGMIQDWMSKEHNHFSAVLIDIDNFKMLNDNYGHLYGDEILVEMARLMKEQMKDKGIVARYGGEEFMLLFECSDRQTVLETMDRIRTGIAEYSMKTKQIKVTFSGGMEEYWTDAKIDMVLRAVDQKLYQAKNNGKDQIIG
ncbi:MAG: GGDEF domain-containing protein [Lachnospiraceae bacterium]